MLGGEADLFTDDLSVLHLADLETSLELMNLVEVNCVPEEARDSIVRWIIQEYNHDRPHRGVRNRTPHEAFLAFAGVLKNEALTV